MIASAGVITSYSIHYTKLYDVDGENVAFCIKEHQGITDALDNRLKDVHLPQQTVNGGQIVGGRA